MSRPSAGSVLGATLLCYVLALFAFLLYSALSSPPTLLRSMHLSYAGSRALLSLVENLPALSAAGSMIAFTLFVTGGSAHPAPDTMHAVVRPSLTVLLALTLGYVVLAGLAAPRLWRTVLGMEESSLMAAGHREAMEQATARAERTGASADYDEAQQAAERYLAIDADNREISEAERALHQATLDARAAEMERSGVEPVEPPLPAEGGADPVDLLRSAEAYYEAGDYYSAHYYATLAQTSPVVARRAAALVAAADDRISPRLPLAEKTTPEEQARAERSRLKREAYGLYEQGDWVAAYYRFGELDRIYPDDPDIGRYYGLSREKALTTAFMLDAARTALLEGGVEGLLFAVDRGQSGVEVMSIGKMVRSASGTFFADLEMLRYTPGRGPTLHLFARYGMLAEEAILLHAMDSTERWRSELPVVYVAADPAEITVALRPGYPLDSLEYIRPDPRALRAVPPAALWGMRSWARGSGLMQEAIDLEILVFFVRPVMFVVLGLFSLAVAWRQRGRYFGRPSPLAYGAIALFPFAMSGAWALITDGARLAYGGLLAGAGLVPAAVVAAVSQGTLLLAGLVALARSTLE